jgi:hypothetical protein
VCLSRIVDLARNACDCVVFVQKLTIFTCTKMARASLQCRRARASSEWLAGGRVTRAFVCHDSESSLFIIIVAMP